MSKLAFVQSNGELKSLIDGVEFNNITSGWCENYEVAIKWSGDKKQLMFSGIVITGSGELAKQLFAKLFVNGKSAGTKRSFYKWSKTPFEFEMKAGETARIVFEFSAKEINSSLQGLSNSFDFEFGEVEVVRKEQK
jgi:hypothetical protein